MEFVNRLEASGGTNIDEALVKALGLFKDSNKPSMVVFLTDGEPTIGKTDIQGILNDAENANRHNARVFVFGVGNDVNTHLLDNLARKHRGVSDYILPEEKIEVKVSSFYRKKFDHAAPRSGFVLAIALILLYNASLFAGGQQNAFIAFLKVLLIFTSSIVSAATAASLYYTMKKVRK